MKKFASLLLTVALLAAMLCVFAVPASAETDIIENQEGATWLVDEGDDHVWYKLTENSTKLIIGGKGAIPDYEFITLESRPWHNAAKTITTIQILSGVTSIGNYAFDTCESLTSATIPVGVTSIGSSAFGWCKNLTSVTVKASTPPTLKYSNTFNNTPNLVIYVPYGTSGDYKSANNWENATIREKIREAYIIDDKCTESGTVTADKDCFPVSNFAADQTVTVTVVPSEGRQLKKGSLLIEYRENGDRKFITPTQDETDPMKYSFIMPAANVIATVCEHDFGNDHICTKCGEKDCVFGLADHTWDANTGKCTVCEYVCPHDGNTCVECGANIHGGEIVQNLGSTLSEGSLTIILCVACLAVGFLVAMFIFKKKMPALADGTDKTDGE
ncbi:MAG: leucine-rich repeat domain-containing protein [Clostridia bacterium]|nr:leucine-rich repeat domain-containing protein [Clostridia bacterium]